ncbi:histidine phosphatase family protein [Sandaracinobacter sp. RS1-74]|uniref:histidine phosphatase family protein n=1 Tax=Sandaracinobacteroides sayramensis TaxID=2913411 RepID=UPI001EDC099F|nr:histidine phosphatase family protein [Sandaracinobacteroides sayramensis]MCG2841943.1 histidine phosphatase family protein [Sandaracinobacteroides sayramensis]
MAIRMFATTPSPLYLARHAETVFNRARRMQGNDAHTPLTRDGIAQAEAMGEALRLHFAESGEPLPEIWASPAGRTLQTASIVAEHLGRTFFDIRQDPRLREIEVGRWTGRDYAAIVADEGEIMDREHRLFRMPIPEGEHYADIAGRLSGWLAQAGAAPALVISHGITSRVLRGLLVGGRAYAGVEIAADLPQGSISRIADGAERALHIGSGASGPRAA